MEWLSQLNEEVFQGLTPLATLVNLLLIIICGNILAWHYLRFSKSIGNKRKFARLFVFLAATTMMVISVVKTSLALSLGLVGALSIIRFRTPVKEPEDLAYIFLALATGIGFGADMRLPTAIMFFGVLLAMTFQRGNRHQELPQLYLHFHTPLGEGDQALTAEAGLDKLLEETDKLCNAVDLRRVDSEANTLNATLVLDLDQTRQIGTVIGRLQETFPHASVSVVEGATFE